MADAQKPDTASTEVEVAVTETIDSTETAVTTTEQTGEDAQETANADGTPAATDNGELDPNTGWLPLESNPAVVNPFAHKMGLPKEWGFCDIFGLEDWAFDMVSSQRCVIHAGNNCRSLFG